ncbi:SIMPL domain-containing protein [Halosquirtibacter laminarini]|uniref:SIMPL domain-containing protein n=1 Tax=Halosquirtibacter laminarini TaxID=3374600 RepID=A0AC61NEJ2_9BACT|nr:SIMPL domain-containing protein [Prolixibacteraceae bacterium]
MKNRILLVLSLVLFSVSFTYASNSSHDDNDCGTIDVSSDAEELVLPKKVFINLELVKLPKMKDGKPIQVMEDECIKLLDAYDIPRKNLKVVSVDNKMVTKRKSQIGVSETRKYELEVTDFTILDNLFLEFSQMKYLTASLGRYDYGNLDEIRNQLAVKAAVKAKEKGTMIINALGLKFVRIMNVNVNNYSNTYARAARVNYMAADAIEMKSSGPNYKSANFEIQKMKVVSSVSMKIMVI